MTERLPNESQRQFTGSYYGDRPGAAGEKRIFTADELADELAYRGSGPVDCTWRDRDNFLTNLLDVIGVGEQITIRYCRLSDTGEAVIKEATVAIEISPPDFGAANRWTHRALGLTIKDLTYEVRKALAMAPQAPGVVVAAVEPGSPASLARIWPNEIITHANGIPLADADGLRKIVAAANEAGRPLVRLTVQRLGKVRFADIAVAAYAKASDEGRRRRP